MGSEMVSSRGSLACGAETGYLSNQLSQVAHHASWALQWPA